MDGQERAHPEYVTLTRYLGQVVRGGKLLDCVDGLLICAAVFLIVLLAGVGLETLRVLSPLLPLTVTVLLALLFFSAFLLALSLVVRRRSLRWAALYLQERDPALKDNVINSLLLAEQVRRGEITGQGAGLVTAFVAETTRRLGRRSLREIVDISSLSRRGLLVAFLGATLGVILLIHPASVASSVSLFRHPFAGLGSSSSTLEVTPQGGVVPRGVPLVIRATFSGRSPTSVGLLLWEGGRESRVPMERETERQFRYTLSPRDTFQYQAVSGESRSGLYSLQVVDPPEVGKIRITLTPPDYTRLPAVRVEEGSFAALPGTSLQLEIQTTTPVREGTLLLEESSGSPREVPLTKSGWSAKRLLASHVFLNPLRYQIRLRDENGFSNPEPARYEGRVIPDTPPQVDLLFPSTDLVVSGEEGLMLEYRVSDDFGLTRLTLLYRTSSGGERRVSLQERDLPKSLPRGRYPWEISALALTPGEAVTFWLEAWDNDTISGPKVGTSRTVTLTLRDDREKVAETGTALQEISESLLDALATHLEGRPPGEVLSRLAEVERQVGNVAERTDGAAPRDWTLRSDLGALQKSLEYARTLSPPTPERMTSALERAALLAEEIARGAKMREMEEIAKEIEARQQRLLDALKDLQERSPPGGREAAMKELGRLAELMGKIAEALSALATELPEDFLNSDALKNLNVGEMFAGLEEIRKKLAEGDIAGALQAARDLMEALSQMLASLAEAGRQAASAPFGQMQREARGASSELQAIVREQQRILRETERMRDGLRARGERTPEGKEAPLTLEEAETVGSLASGEGDLTERTGRIAERARALSQFFPLLDPAIPDNLEAAARAMGEATGHLQRKAPTPAVPPEREALERLTQTQRALESAMQQMAMRSQMGVQGLPRLFRSGPFIPFGSLIPIPGGPEPPRFSPERGIMGLNRENVRIPKPEDSAPPQIRREEVMESLKEKVPPEFRRKVEEYFRRLTE